MNRKEYLASLNQPSRPTHERSGSHTSISSLSEYIALRRKCEEYEESGRASDEFTAEDYRLFDENFNKALQDALYVNDEFTESEIDYTIKMMEAVDWIWANFEHGAASTPDHNEFVKNIKYCYEQCFNDGHPRASCGTGGITVAIDILDHLVKIQFSSIDVVAYDGDDLHDE